MPWAIKWRDRKGTGKRPWWFMTSTGGGNRLKAHAATWPNEMMADRACERLAADNPTTEFMVVDLDSE